jgi:hypothetical protein
MTTKIFFTAESIICLLFGISLTFMADTLATEYLADPAWLNDGFRVVAAGYGTLLLACAVAYWTVRNSGPSDGRKALLLIALISNACLVILHTKAILSGVETAFTWGTVAMCAVFAAWSSLILTKGDAV